MPALDFSPSSITKANKTIYVYGKTVMTGNHKILVKLSSKSVQIPNVLDSAHDISVGMNASFFATQITVLTGEMLGCSTGSIFCIQSPTANDRNSFKNQQVFASQLLPLSDQGLKFNAGTDIETAATSPLPGISPLLFKDILSIYAKKVTSSDNPSIAAYLSNKDYMRQMGLEFNGSQNFGVTFSPFGVSITDGRTSITLAHEMIHALNVRQGADIQGHSPITNVYGINVGTKMASTKFMSPILDTRVVPHSVPNLFSPSPPDNDLDVLLDNSTYDATFSKILSLNNIDPKIIVVSGYVNAAGNVVTQNFQRSDSGVLSTPIGSDIKISGYDSNGKLMSSVTTQAVTSFEIIGSAGSTEVSVPGYLFAATLADAGNIAKVVVTKGSKVVASKAVAELNLSKVVGLLVRADFRKTRIAESELRILQAELSAYEKLVSKSKKREAVVALVLMKLTAECSLKNDFILRDDSSMTKKQFLKLIDQEISKLR